LFSKFFSKSLCNGKEQKWGPTIQALSLLVAALDAYKSNHILKNPGVCNSNGVCN
jgi:hypothetical protein